MANTSAGPAIAIYVHIPFCVQRCPYCDFATVAGQDALIPRYVSAVLRELACAPMRGREVATVYFGGGTPTYLPETDIAELLDAIGTAFRFSPKAEISFEANPASSDRSRFASLRGAGFNRASIGVQSFDEYTLRRLDRAHTAADGMSAVEYARSAGFDNIGIDLIFGVPGQTDRQWRADLDRAISLGIEHVSAYNLTIEDGTRFGDMQARGTLRLPSEDARAAMYEDAIATLTSAGYEHYEVSNFARPDRRCRHNMAYWTDVEYLGFGAAAASYVGGARTVNEKGPARYIARIESGLPAAELSEALDMPTRLREALMLGLRLRDGIDRLALRRRFGADAVDALEPRVRDLTSRGLLERTETAVRLTHRGLMLADTVIVELMAD